MIKNKTLPQILILKRKFTQRFPNGYEVGLYYSDDLQQYISIPLQDSHIGITKESVLESLNNISEQDIIDNIQFQDSSELTLNKECADIVLNYIKEHDDDISLSDKSFLEILSKATITEEEIQG